MPIDSGFDRLVAARIYIQCFAIGESPVTSHYILNIDLHLLALMRWTD